QTLSVHRHAPYRVEAASACLAARGSDYFGGAVVDSTAAVPGANVFTRRQKIQHASSTAISSGAHIRITSSSIARQPARIPANMNTATKVHSTGFIPPPYR